MRRGSTGMATAKAAEKLIQPEMTPELANHSRACWVSLLETLYGWLSRANRVMRGLDDRCFHVAVVCAEQLVSLKSAA
jgi:hypothetical protein